MPIAVNLIQIKIKQAAFGEMEIDSKEFSFF